MKPHKNDIPYYLLLLIAGGVFYVLNLQTPFMHDDYAYCFYYDSDSTSIRPTGIWVTGIWQMFQSMWHHYLCVNGRFSSHLLLQSFCAFLGKGAFNVLNSFVFLILLHTLVRLTCRRKSIPLLAIAFLSTLCILPFPGQTMLWMAGSLNYLWPTTFSLVFICWLTRYSGTSLALWKHLLLFLSCLAVGWSNESISIPVTIGLFFFFLFNRTSFRNGAVSSTMGYALGALFILIAPGTWQRMQGWENVLDQQTPLQVLFIHSYNLAWGCIHSILPVIAIAVVLLFSGRNRWRFAPFRKSLLAWLFLGFSCFLFTLGWDEERIFFGFSVFSLVIITRTLQPILSKLDGHFSLSLALIFLCAIPAAVALRATASFFNYDRLVYEEVRRAPSKCVVREHSYSDESRYVFATTLKPDRYAFHNRVKSFYFGKEFIQALPDDLFDIVTSGRLASSLTSSNKEVDGRPLFTFAHYWVLPVDEIPAKQLLAVFYYRIDNSGLKAHQKVIRHLLNTLDSATDESLCFGIECGGNKFLVIPQKSEKNLIQIRIIDYLG